MDNVGQELRASELPRAAGGIRRERPQPLACRDQQARAPRGFDALSCRTFRCRTRHGFLLAGDFFKTSKVTASRLSGQGVGLKLFSLPAILKGPKRSVRP